jgi:hypothetical protein
MLHLYKSYNNFCLMKYELFIILEKKNDHCLCVCVCVCVLVLRLDIGGRLFYAVHVMLLIVKDFEICSAVSSENFSSDVAHYISTFPLCFPCSVLIAFEPPVCLFIYSFPSMCSMCVVCNM